MAEGAGFEPAIRFPAYTLSRRAPSTTRPPLHCSVSWTKGSTYVLPVGFLKSLGMPYAPERRDYSAASRKRKRTMAMPADDPNSWSFELRDVKEEAWAFACIFVVRRSPGLRER